MKPDGSLLAKLKPSFDLATRSQVSFRDSYQLNVTLDRLRTDSVTKQLTLQIESIDLNDGKRDVKTSLSCTFKQSGDQLALLRGWIKANASTQSNATSLFQKKLRATCGGVTLAEYNRELPLAPSAMAGLPGNDSEASSGTSNADQDFEQAFGG